MGKTVIHGRATALLWGFLHFAFARLSCASPCSLQADGVLSRESDASQGRQCFGESCVPTRASAYLGRLMVCRR